jgi:hypothetical protein
MKAQDPPRRCKPGIIPGRETCASKNVGKGRLRSLANVRPDLSEIRRLGGEGNGCWYRERHEGGESTCLVLGPGVMSLKIYEEAEEAWETRASRKETYESI